MSKPVIKFIETVLQHFPPYRWDEAQEKAWAATMVQELSGFSDAVLNRAIGELVRTRKNRQIPLVSECLTACAEARRWLDAETSHKLLPTTQDAGFRYPEWAYSRIALADDLVCGRKGSPHIGQEAARENFWILQLHDFCRQEQRLPNDKEIANLKRKARETDEVFSKGAVGHGPIAQFAVKAIETVGAKRRQLCEMVEGKWVRPAA